MASIGQTASSPIVETSNAVVPIERTTIPSRALDYRSRIPALDGLRGLAILSVFLYHYAGGLSHSGSAILGGIGSVMGLGWSGVDLFFVLSGFLITGILYDTIGSDHYYRNFYARRVLRIFPIYYIVALICLFLAPVLGIHWQFRHVAFLFYVGYPAALVWPGIVSLGSLQITHLWSLCVEEQYYMVWPWLVSHLRNRSAILWACATAGATALTIRVVLTLLGVSGAWSYALVFCRMDTLAVGAAIAVLMRSQWRGIVDRLGSVLFIVSVALIAVCCFSRHTVDHDDALISTVGYSLLAIAGGSLLVLCVRSGSVWARVFSNRALRITGKYSYGFYLYHFPLLALLGPLRPFLAELTHSFAIGGILYLVLSLAVNLSVAALSFHFIESPIMNFKRRFAYRGMVMRPEEGASA